jgi:uncharacterized protein (DUF934 family)
MQGHVNGIKVFLGDEIVELLDELNGFEVVQVHFPVATDQWLSCLT